MNIVEQDTKTELLQQFLQNINLTITMQYITINSNYDIYTCLF